MMPPTPSMNSMPVSVSIALRLNAISSPKSMLRPSRAAARSGDSGARKRQGAIASTSLAATGRPSALSKTAGSLVSTTDGL